MILLKLGPGLISPTERGIDENEKNAVFDDARTLSRDHRCVRLITRRGCQD